MSFTCFFYAFFCWFHIRGCQFIFGQLLNFRYFCQTQHIHQIQQRAYIFSTERIPMHFAPNENPIGKLTLNLFCFLFEIIRRNIHADHSAHQWAPIVCCAVFSFVWHTDCDAFHTFKIIKTTKRQTNKIIHSDQHSQIDGGKECPFSIHTQRTCANWTMKKKKQNLYNRDRLRLPGDWFTQ